MRTCSCLVVLVLTCTGLAEGSMRITEYMYSGAGGEFIEFTNIGAAPIDMTGWSYDDDSGTSGTVSLSAYGIVLPGESVILAESAEAAFRTTWLLPAGVKVIGGLTVNLGRADQINLFDSTSALVDRLTYNDQSSPPTIRTQNVSGWTSYPNLGLNNISLWQLSSVADAQGSYMAVGGDVGNPGVYIPEPATLALLGMGLAMLRHRGR